jgi:hypothetical protein
MQKFQINANSEFKKVFIWWAYIISFVLLTYIFYIKHLE